MIDGSLEAVPCDLCGRDEAAPLVTKNNFRVVRCRNCDLVYVNPRPRPNALASLYDASSYQEHQAKRAEQTEADTDWRRTAQARLTLLDEVQPGRGNLLDVGCSTGAFLTIARERGWQVRGLDVSAGSVAKARERGLDVCLATLENHPLPPGMFQVITMLDSIEHMPSPLTALRAVHDLLAPGGVVVLTTPNVEGLVPRATWQVFGRTVGAWEHPTPPGHIYQFGRTTLRAALRLVGFEVAHETTEAIPLDHTVGELEGELVEALKGRGARPKAELPGSESKPPARLPRTARAKGEALQLSRRVVRQAVRAGAWAFIGSMASLAALTGSGDSLIVIARKPRQDRLMQRTSVTGH